MTTTPVEMLQTLLEQERLYEELKKTAQQVKTTKKHKQLSIEELANIGFVEMADQLANWIPEEHGELLHWLLKKASHGMSREIERETTYSKRNQSLESMLEVSPDFIEQEDYSVNEIENYTSLQELTSSAAECAWSQEAFSDRLDMITILSLLEDLDRADETIEIVWMKSSGTTEQVIAEQLGIPIGSVAWLYKAAISRLTTELSMEFDEIVQSLRDVTRPDHGEKNQLRYPPYVANKWQPMVMSEYLPDHPREN